MVVLARMPVSYLFLCPKKNREGDSSVDNICWGHLHGLECGDPVRYDANAICR